MSDNDNFTRAQSTFLDIETATDKAAVFDHVFKFAQLMGFQVGTLGMSAFPGLHDINYDDLGVSNYPEAFQLEYIKREFILHDPVIQKAISQDQSFFWHDLDGEFSRTARDVMELAVAHGMNDGFTVPVHMGTQACGVASFATDTPCELTEENAKLLELVAIHGLTKLMDICGHTQARIAPKLSPRELEAVHHVACGKQDDQIGFEMGISAHSVREYLSSARQKLGASNRAHSVMIAIRDGLISF